MSIRAVEYSFGPSEPGNVDELLVWTGRAVKHVFAAHGNAPPSFYTRAPLIRD